MNSIKVWYRLAALACLLGLPAVAYPQAIQFPNASPAGFAARWMHWAGAWNSSTVYNAQDVVIYNGATYVSAVGPNAANTPAPGSLFWTLLGGGGSGSMTWPAGAGIAVYSGSSSWATSLAAPAGAIVGTTDTQTLTSKTVDGVSPAVFGYLPNITSDVQAQLDSKESVGNKGAANGYAGLDAVAHVPLANLPPASGDVTGALSSTVVTRLQGLALANTAPADGQALVWSNANSAWQPGTVSGSGASMATQLGDFAVTRTSATVLTVGANCSAATPCNVRLGAHTYSFGTSATATITAGTGIAYIYVDTSGALTVASGMTVSCSGCTSVAGSAFPAAGIPVWSWAASAGTWAAAGTDARALLARTVVLAGTGLQLAQTADSSTFSVESTALPPLLNAGGDVTGTLSATVVAGLQGRALSASAPTDGQALVWSNANSAWQPGTVSGSAKAQPLFGSWNPGAGLGVAASTTQYFALNSVATNAAESRMAVPVPVAGTLSAWYLRTVSSQPSDNSMTCSVRVNLATPTNTLSITIPANQAAAVLSDLAHSVHVNAGDAWDIMCVNASTSTSAYMTLVSFKFLPD
jgi:hypothetical protein